MSTLRWGILGTGNIARQFCAGAKTSRRATLVAVGSRSPETAQAFARDWGIPAHGSYEDVLKRDDVDAIYLSFPNSLHHQWTIRALDAGKHVLCEKPLACSLSEASEMFAAARRNGRVLDEAFMYRAHPLTRAVVETIRSGAIGQVKLIRSSFCYRTRKVEGNIRFDAALAGGALMDIGCYCIDFSRLIATADPLQVRAFGKLHERGVDDYAVGAMDYPGGIVASFTCGMTLQADNTAYVCGDEGWVEVPVPWKPPPTGATYVIGRGTPPKQDGAVKAPPPREVRTVDAGQDLYGIEADHFAATVLDGTAPLLSEAESLSNMRVLEEMRRQVGTLR